MFKKILTVFLIILAFFLTVDTAAAWDYGLSAAGQGGGYKTSGNETEILSIVNTSVNIGLSLLAVIFIAIMFYAGLRWMTARGNEELIGRAQTALQAAIIGLIVVVASYAISYFLIDILISDTANSVSTTECCCDYTKGMGKGECKTTYYSEAKCTKENTNIEKVKWVKNEVCNSKYKSK